MRHSGGGWPVRRTLEAPMRGGPPWDRPTHATRQRQLRDEVKSGGSQPTHIRMIHRRSSAARRLNLDPMPVGAPPARFGTKHPVNLWPSPSDRRAPCGAWGPPVDNAGAVDAEEDARFGEDFRGDELPEELRRREDRLAAIRAAKERLEARQREADEARGRKPGMTRNPRGGRPTSANTGSRRRRRRTISRTRKAGS